MRGFFEGTTQVDRYWCPKRPEGEGYAQSQDQNNNRIFNEGVSTYTLAANTDGLSLANG